MGPSIAINKNNLKPSHSGNTYPVRFRAIFDVKTLLKTLAMALDQDITCQIFPLGSAPLPILTGRIAQWVHLFSVDFNHLPYSFNLNSKNLRWRNDLSVGTPYTCDYL